MRNQSIHHSCLAFVVCLLTGYAGLVWHEGFAQSQTSAISSANSPAHATADSSLLEWSAASAHEVLRLRVQRWLTKNQQKASLVSTNVAALLQEAEGLAQSQDYVTAQLLLEMALELIETASSSAAVSTSSEEERPFSKSNISPARMPARWQTQQEVLLGVDLSRLEYVLGSPALEEIFTDISARSLRSTGNPFAGFKFQLGRTPNAPSDLRLLALLKTSRDYDSGALEFYARQALGPEAYLHFENDFEATSYRLETDLRYWQNASTMRAGASLGSNFRLEMEDKLGLRRYHDENLYSPNYLQNEIGLSAALYTGLATRLQARYDYGVRVHGSFPLNDYVEHRIDASIAQHTSQNSSVFVQNLWRTRDYPYGIPDSTFQNSYQEEFLRADLRFGLSEKLALRVEGDLTLRQYQTANNLTPDFFNSRLNPQLEHKIGTDWQVSGGYVFLLQVHGTREQRNPASTSTAVLNGGFYEDYYANGFTLGLDWYSSQGVLLSVNHTYEVRTYPHDPLKDALLPSLYSDYNNHSLLLFLSWKLSTHLQMSAVANYDNQTSRTETGDDLRNTLFSVEVGYSF